MRRNHIDRLASWNTRATEIKRHVDILLDGARLAGLQAMLSDMVAVVRGIYNICVIEQIVLV